MHILVFLLIIVVAVFVMGLAAIGNIIRAVFGLGRDATSRQQTKRQGQYTSSSQQQNQSQHNKDESKTDPKNGKVFAQDEGEYIEFEEIKD